MDRIEELLQTPYWIIDILPKQVPKDSPGQYFAVEDFFLKEELSEMRTELMYYKQKDLINEEKIVSEPTPMEKLSLAGDGDIND